MKSKNKKICEKASRIALYIVFILMPIISIRWHRIMPFESFQHGVIFTLIIFALAGGWYFFIFHGHVFLLPIFLIACLRLFWIDHHVVGIISFGFAITSFLMKSDPLLAHKRWKMKVCLIFAFFFFAIAILSAMII